MDDQGAPKYFLRPESVCVDHRQNSAQIAQQRRQIACVVGVGTATGIPVGSGVGKGIFAVPAAGGPFVDVKAEEGSRTCRKIHREPCRLHSQKRSAAEGIQEGSAVDVGMLLISPDDGAGGRLLEEQSFRHRFQVTVYGHQFLVQPQLFPLPQPPVWLRLFALLQLLFFPILPTEPAPASKAGLKA